MDQNWLPQVQKAKCRILSFFILFFILFLSFFYPFLWWHKSATVFWKKRCLGSDTHTNSWHAILMLSCFIAKNSTQSDGRFRRLSRYSIFICHQFCLAHLCHQFVTLYIYIYVIYIYINYYIYIYTCYICIYDYMLYNINIIFFPCHIKALCALRGWLQVASEAAVQRPLLRCHPDTEEEVRRLWRLWRFFGDFHPEKLATAGRFLENLGKLHSVHGLAKAVLGGFRAQLGRFQAVGEDFTDAVGISPVICTIWGTIHPKCADFFLWRDELMSSVFTKLLILGTIKAAPCSPLPWYPAKVHDSVIVTIMKLRVMLKIYID